MTPTWHTAWHGQDIVIYRNDVEVDRLHAADIARVIFVYSGSGESAGDLELAVAEIGDDVVLLPSDTGFAGRVNFERLDFWASRACVYWVSQAQAKLPLRLRRGRWWLRHSPMFTRVPRAELAGLLEHWPVEGPQTWEQRKWRRIEQRRPFTSSRLEEEERKRA